MKAVTLKYTVQTVNEWRAGYSESCKSGSGASVRKPTAAMRQGAGYLAYSTRLASLTTKSTIPTSKAITLSGAPATGYVKSMGYPSSYRDRTREKAMQNTPPKSKGQATKQS